MTLMRQILRIFLLVVALTGCERAWAWSFIENTYLLNVTQRTRLSDVAAKLGRGGYELSGGGFVDFSKWYDQKWIDIEFHFMTQLHEDFGILWGFSTGEWGEKYKISPSLKLGAIVQHRLSDRSSFSLSATRLFGGGFTEKTCVADYGDIGGVQTVNCRLAATQLEPSQTLQYLYRTKPLEAWFGVKYQLTF